MNRTKIEWVRNPDGSPGWTFNPITGCLNNCSYCYARKLANTRLKETYLANHNVAIPDPQTKLETLEVIGKIVYDPFYPRLWTERLDQPFALKKPAGIFTCDMSDLFGIGIPDEWTKSVMNIIDFAYQHRFYLLTKQPQNLVKFSPFPDNCWVGVSATNHLQAKKGKGSLRAIQAKIKFMSFEPLLMDIGFNDTRWAEATRIIKSLDWVIIGALTGTLNDIKKPAMQYPDLELMPLGKRWTLQPKMIWIDEIVSACDKARIPVFLKNNLKSLFDQVFNNCRVFSSPALDKQGSLRQELPK